MEPPWIHDIALLVDLLPAPDAACLSRKEQERLTDYATFTRYPGDYEPITVDEARAAVEIARRAREALRRLMPGACFDT